uniref:uncharacterized protein LOC105349585 n=1 Tax=Fragaria vesca subsp. vesca TaxID=101020 RepID=UPI0005CB3469|nr:PREDICTED: uncharacterized protein LOC105349585 [Fragaria vesca subsp. vesca]
MHQDMLHHPHRLKATRHKKYMLVETLFHHQVIPHKEIIHHLLQATLPRVILLKATLLRVLKDTLHRDILLKVMHLKDILLHIPDRTMPLSPPALLPKQAVVWAAARHVWLLFAVAACWIVYWICETIGSLFV